MQTLTNKRVLLGVTGGIAAYKSAELIRHLQEQGSEVRVVMTEAATEFITPLTLQALSQNPVHIGLLDRETESAMGHIELARWADLILVAPATSNFIAKLVGGHASDLLTTICLAAKCPLAIAPAMNQAMWGNSSTMANCEILLKRGIHFFGPEKGLQACGEEGPGRLLDIETIVIRASSLFDTGALNGKYLVITAGPTREAIDPVRFISNHSSGKQGYAIAEAALDAGARVTLISGPTSIEAPAKAHLIRVNSADEMYEEVHKVAMNADIFIGVAAVADYRPKTVAKQKMKKSDTLVNNSWPLELIQNRDIIQSVANYPSRPFTVGFAAETTNIISHAKQKLIKKNLDMIIANDVSDDSVGFNSDENKTTVLWKNHQKELPMMSKAATASHIIAIIAETLDKDTDD
ncbi:MAG: bifunctional phosphopantothenoylcysteine decarboxylase/phosphopantothenate--cysteine ligase CoaBC [Candidatus Azotimanducaceae bacterium]|uniref:Coenzyme A biosynthesis bifunctional protein CoaBC n=1 Tax=OM182 bacterium TaxID=2510334 RepID=A0A520S5J0_9GAMM|nr:MAG: bifunctional phosphopantothenoylcysteine decarboxylase/phosphopantothenate--cysteine ligase CoaBC [OM182 bacterium]